MIQKRRVNLSQIYYIEWFTKHVFCEFLNDTLNIFCLHLFCWLYPYTSKIAVNLNWHTCSYSLPILFTLCWYSRCWKKWARIFEMEWLEKYILEVWVQRHLPGYCSWSHKKVRVFVTEWVSTQVCAETYTHTKHTQMVLYFTLICGAMDRLKR